MKLNMMRKSKIILLNFVKVQQSKRLHHDPDFENGGVGSGHRSGSVLNENRSVDMLACELPNKKDVLTTQNTESFLSL